MQPRLRTETRGSYHSLLSLCGDETILAWSAAAGALSAILLHGSVYVAALLSPLGFYASVAAAWVAGLLAAFYASCRAYLGARHAIVAGVSGILVYYASAALASTLVYMDAVSALSAAIDYTLLSTLYLYEEAFVAGRRRLLESLTGELREYMVLTLVLLAAGAAFYAGSAPMLAAMLTIAAIYPYYEGFSRYSWRSGLGWSGLTTREKLVVVSGVASLASLAAYYVIAG